MRHARKINALSRTSSHRKALMSNMANALLRHKRIHTTVAKAKALRKYVEPLITRAREDTTHSRRVVFSSLRDKEIIGELYTVIANKVGQRPGGYTRIIRLGTRKGDAAETCMMELVDFNPWTTKTAATKKRSRRGKSTSARGLVQSSASSTAPLSLEEPPQVEAIDSGTTAEVSTLSEGTDSGPMEASASKEASTAEELEGSSYIEETPMENTTFTSDQGDTDVSSSTEVKETSTAEEIEGSSYIEETPIEDTTSTSDQGDTDVSSSTEGEEERSPTDKK